MKTDTNIPKRDDHDAFIAELNRKALLVAEVRRRKAEALLNGTAKKRRVSRRPEQDLQEQCVTYFDLAYHNIAPLLFHCPNEGRRSRVEGAHLKAMGMRKGFPDLVLLLPHAEYNFLAMEFKAKSGRPTEEQKRYAELLPKFMVKHCYIKDFNTFKEIIDSYVDPIYKSSFFK